MSGYNPAMPGPSDAVILLEAMGKPVNPETIAAIAPWRYAAALSPHLAAAREGRSFHFPDILTFCRAAISAAPDLMLVEGVGGVMVPMDAENTVRDWIAALQLPALLVTGTYLGTISHTLTAAEALLARGVHIAAIIINESEISPMPAAETAAAIRKFLPGIAQHIVPRQSSDSSFQALADFMQP
jgi:dethiobiotin synthetase